MPSNQETFDTVVNHLRDQGGPALSSTLPGAVCAYRAPDGRKCAAGVLIPDADYRPSMEGFGIKGCLNLAHGILERDGHSLPLVVALQSAHDGATATSAACSASTCPQNDWFRPIEPRLANVAKDFGLDYEAPV